MINFLQYKNSEQIYFIGIGGVSMSSIALSLKNRGFLVSGSDREESKQTKELEKNGINVNIGHKAENIKNASLVIKNAAIKDDNPEVLEAKRLNIKIIERAEALGSLMLDYKDVVCVAGMHGKTTATGMVSYITVGANLDPEIMIGGYLPLINGGLRLGGKNLFVAEACEYCDSYLSFFPTIAIILNIDEDHLDYFKDLDHIKSSYLSFANRLPEQNGVLVYNNDDKNTADVANLCQRKKLSFGIDGGDIKAVNIKEHSGFFSFDVLKEQEIIANITLAVPGKHNIYNALASFCAGVLLNVPYSQIKEGLESFKSTGRRFELVGRVNDALVIDDYAHHPTELKATLKTAKKMAKGRVICVFQPHTYSRTNALLSQFADALSIADIAVLADIYAAREKNTYNISSTDIQKKLKNAIYLNNFDDIEKFIKSHTKNGDIIITAGAGDIYKVAYKFKEVEKNA